MQAVANSEVRKNIKKYFDRVYHDNDPLIVTRKNNENVVVISLEEYNSLIETNYLLSSKNNAERITNSLNKLNNGQGLKKDLIEV